MLRKKVKPMTSPHAIPQMLDAKRTSLTPSGLQGSPVTTGTRFKKNPWSWGVPIPAWFQVARADSARLLQLATPYPRVWNVVAGRRSKFMTNRLAGGSALRTNACADPSDRFKRQRRIKAGERAVLVRSIVGAVPDILAPDGFR